MAPVGGAPTPLRRGAPDVGPAGHRTRLRFFAVHDGHLSLEVQAELLAPTRTSVGVPVGFVRSGHHVRPVDPTVLPGANRPAGDGGVEAVPDVSDALRRTRLWIMLRERTTGAEAYAASAVQVESTPEIGTPSQRRFTIRFAAYARFDLLAALAPATTGSWEVYTVLESVGSRSTAALGAYRDRVPVDARLCRTELSPGLWLDPQLTGLGPRLVLDIGYRD